MNDLIKPRFSSRFWLTALVLAWAVDLLFWGKPIGISSFLWIFLLLVGLFGLAWSEGARPARLSLVLVVLILALSGMSVLRLEGFTRFINIIMALFAITILVTTYRSGYWLYYRLVDYIMPFLELIGSGFSRPIKLMETASQETTSTETNESGWRTTVRNVAPYLRGLVIALPILLILGALLASADPVFSGYMEKFLKIFDIERLPEYLLRLVYILMLAFIFTGYYLHAILPAKERSRPDTQKPWFKPFLGWIESGIVLLSVDLLFAFFVAIQFRYLFGGQANISAVGYTYSEYARRGFSELVAVAVLSLLLYQGLGLISRLNKHSQQRSFTGLSVTLLILVLVILASALQRLLLYEDAYGFTSLRTYTHVFIFWLALLLLATIVLELVQRRGTFALAMLLACFGFSLSLGLLNVDGFIANQNLQRTRQGYELDFPYLTTLSDDAVPVLVEQFSSPDLPSAAHEVLGAGLACRTALLSEQTPLPWQSFHPAVFQARRLLLKENAPWRSYTVWKKEGRWWIKVNGNDQACTSYRFMD